MVLLGQYSETDIMQKEFLADLPAARQRLSQFKTLNVLFSGFKGYENKVYETTRNIFLRWCLPFHANDAKLTEVEEALVLFDALKWRQERVDCLKERICSDDFYVSLTQYTELAYARWLVERLGKDKVEIYPKLTTGKISDIVVKMNSRNVYLELGNLSESLPERKIQKVLNAAASHLRTKFNETVLVLMEVNTLELLVLDAENHIDEKASTLKICGEIDRLCLEHLRGFKGMVNLSDIAFAAKNRAILEQLGKLVLPQDRRKLDFINEPSTDKWLRACKGELVVGSKFINWFSINDAKFLLVEVHPIMAFPSKAAMAEMDSFLNHVTRHINGQLAQLQPGSPNIIVVQGFNWVMFGLGDDFEDVEPLHTKIQAYLEKKKLPHLSGIAFFSEDFSKSMFVPNGYALKESELSADEVQYLGMRAV